MARRGSSLVLSAAAIAAAAAGCAMADEEPGGVQPAGGSVTSPVECTVPFSPDCTATLPYSESFDGIHDPAHVGWEFLDKGTPAANHWSLGNEGELGPDGFLTFASDPVATTVRSVAHGPRIDCSPSELDSANVLKTTTMQWRMWYRHAFGAGPITLRAVVSTDGGETWTSIHQWTGLKSDLEYAIHSHPLPGDAWKAADVRVGFEVDTGTGSTYGIEDLEIDDVKLAAGVPNRFVKAQVLKCHDGAPDCSFVYNYDTVCDTDPKPGSSIPKCDVKPGEDLPEINMGVCDWYKVIACYTDPDATYSTWSFFGYPASRMDGSPLEDLPFFWVEGCFSDVSTFCSPGPNAFMCAIEIRPDCDETYAGSHRTGIVTVDEYDPQKKPHSIFETLTKLSLNLLLDNGWVVWAPNGVTDPAAVALRAAVAATGRTVQVIKDIRIIEDLSNYSGVIAVLGVRGRNHVVTDDEADKLADYLRGGGRVWVEGGDFFTEARQPVTVLHPLLKAWARADGPAGTATLAGPAIGRNFLEGLTFELPPVPLNNTNDLLGASPATGAREVLRVEGASPGALMVTYEGSADGGPVYRTVASSFSWSALAAGSPPAEALQRLLSFLENGYPGCKVPAECEDFDPCTADSCNGGKCTNQRDPACTECLNDLVMEDRVTPSCAAGQACVVSKGLCTPILCGGQPCDLEAGSTSGPVAFSPGAPATMTVDVVEPVGVRAVQVAVRLSTPYRGDVVLTLVAPDGTEVRLKDRDSLDRDPDVHATYDIGVPLPEDQSLSVLAGLPLKGTWTLRVETAVPSASGELLSWRLHASVRHEDGHACTSHDDCRSAWCEGGTCKTPIPLKTLLFEEDCWTDWPQPFADAIGRLGWEFYDAGGESDFQDALAAAKWDLVVHVRYRTQTSPKVLKALQAHVEAGGRLILSTWDPKFKHALYGLMGVADGTRFEAPVPIHAWDEGHPLFALPFGVGAALAPVQDTCISDGARVTVGTGTAVAGFTAEPAAGEAAVVIGPEDRTIYLGEMPFLFAPDDLRGLLVNMLHWMATH